MVVVVFVSVVFVLVVAMWHVKHEVQIACSEIFIHNF